MEIQRSQTKFSSYYSEKKSHLIGNRLLITGLYDYSHMVFKENCKDLILILLKVTVISIVPQYIPKFKLYKKLNCTENIEISTA